jgi:hypothetical protein
MVMLNEEQRIVLGWVITVGSSCGLIALSSLVVYSIYALYRVIRNFSKKY